jgi:hypothetical protein
MNDHDARIGYACLVGREARRGAAPVEVVWLPAPTGSAGLLSTSSGYQQRDQASDDRSGEESNEDRENERQDIRRERA